MKDLKKFVKDHKKAIKIGGAVIGGIGSYLIVKKVFFTEPTIEINLQITKTGNVVQKGSELEKHYPEVYKKAIEIGKEVFSTPGPFDGGMIYIGSDAKGNLIADITK